LMLCIRLKSDNKSPASLLQAQRDFFGAHTDKPQWPEVIG
jgi:6-phosphogluconate dehydrogenase